MAAITTGCWYSLDKQTGTSDAASTTCAQGTSPTCLAVQPMFASIQTNILNANLCNAGACHDGNSATPQGKVDLRDNMAYAHLVNFDSILTPGYKLVVPNMPSASYLLVMLGKIQPTDATPPAPPIPGSVGLMPQNGGGVLCCQKLDAVEQWIMNGAMNN